MTVRTGHLQHQLVIRVSEDLYQRLQRDADDHGRTVAQSVRWHLRRQLGIDP